MIQTTTLSYRRTTLGSLCLLPTGHFGGWPLGRRDLWAVEMKMLAKEISTAKKKESKKK